MNTTRGGMQAALNAGWLQQKTQFIRTIRHFPVSALWQRLRLKIGRKLYKCPTVPQALLQPWPSIVLPAKFDRWRYQNDSSNQTPWQNKARSLLENNTGEILNETFVLFENSADLAAALESQSPLWRENYGYLQFLRPLIFSPPTPSSIALIEKIYRQFWQLPPQQRFWSTYGVSRRLLTSIEILPQLHLFPADFQQEFQRLFYTEACYLACFPELDIRGNHLIKNLKAWLATTLVFEKIPAAQSLAKHWWPQLTPMLPAIFAEQLLSDGMHFERTPMYHAWVLQDLLDCIHWLQQEKPETACLDNLTDTAVCMLEALSELRHCSGELPLFGDSSKPQIPDLAALLAYGEAVTGKTVNPPTKAFTHFPLGGFAVFRQENPEASLILDCGDFGPKRLPAHSHCDMGSFELHVHNHPVIVDSGISEYEPSLLRQYFRGTAGHNTVWVPGEEQAEIWSSFRLAEYPRVELPVVKKQTDTTKVTLAYDNHQGHYRHQRSVSNVNNRLWMIEDQVSELYPAGRDCFSLLHIHPDLVIRLENAQFRIGEHLLIVPFGHQKLEWSDQSPWRQNLNLYSPGFSLARPGKLIALTPKPQQRFGWLLIPLQAEKTPRVISSGTDFQIAFEDGKTCTINL